MWSKHNRTVLNKILLLLVILLLSMVGVLGCARAGFQPKGWSGGTIADGTIFIGSMKGRLVAVDISSGRHRVSEPLKTPQQAAAFGCAPGSTSVAIYGTPAVAGNLVYVGGYNGKIYALNSSSLKDRWVYPREGTLQPIVGEIVVALGKVYFGGSDGKVYALDAAEGYKEWEFQTGNKIWSTPAIDDNTLYIGSFDKKLYALRATDGSKKWEFEVEGAIASSPLVYNNTVYVGSFDRRVYAIDATSGKQRWKSKVDAGNWFWSRLVVHNNVIYAANLDGKVYVLNSESGDEVVPAFDLGNPLPSSPVLLDSSVIIASEKGQVYALDTSNNQSKQIADLEEKVYAPLCAHQGLVYVHTEKGTVYEVNGLTGAIRQVYSIKK